MDGFPPMPVEIVRLIMLETVRVRGVRRAVRLRLVNQFWNREVTEAIIQSGILDSFDSVYSFYSSFLWPRYLMHKLRQSQNLLSRPLRILRRVAQRVVTFHSGKPHFETDDAIQEYLWDLCQLSVESNRIPLPYRFWFTVPEQLDCIYDSDDEFMRTLLAAAAATNHLALVQELLPLTQDFLHLIFQDGLPLPECNTILGYALETAAFQGHVEMLRMLLRTIQDPLRLEDAGYDAMIFACAGNQLGTLELCLEVHTYERLKPDPADFLEDTTSIAVFDRVFHFFKDNFVPDRYNPWKPKLDKRQLQLRFLSNQFSSAAVRGNLAMMKYLVQLGVSSRHIDWNGNDERGYWILVTRTAANGHPDVLAYLLENGGQVGSRSLEAASRHGNIDSVRILLEQGTRDSFKPGSALLESVKRENDPVLRLLLDSFTPLDDDLKQQALDIAEKEGLTSMAKILKEYR